MKEIYVKYFTEEIDKLEYIEGKSDWIDLRAAEDIELKAGEYRLIPLGVAIELPVGYEAHIVPRSSTFKNFGIIQTNHQGIIDETYCGDDDQWFMPVYATRDTVIHKNNRICQFRIMKHQPKLEFNEVKKLYGRNRGGIGATGIDWYIDMISKKNIIKEYVDVYEDLGIRKSIIFIYPEQANKSAIFVENKSKVAQIILQILKIRDLIISNNKIISQMMFD